MNETDWPAETDVSVSEETVIRPVIGSNAWKISDHPWDPGGADENGQPSDQGVVDP